MPKKTLGLILGLLATTVLLLFLALRTGKGPLTPSPVSVLSPTPTPVVSTVLAFSPNTVTLDQTGRGTIDVSIDTGENAVAAVQLEIAYDPKILRNVTIQQAGLFQNASPLKNSVDTNTGRITFIMGITPAQAKTPIKGKGSIATITFTQAATTIDGITKMSILPKSQVGDFYTGQGHSVLKSTGDATITLNRQVVPQQPSTPPQQVTTSPVPQTP